MPAKVKLIILTFLISVTLSVAPQGLIASGYHPFFDEAVREAELIILGKVVDAWDPEIKEESHLQDGRRFEEGRVYRMKVERVYKGKAEAGEEVIFWDPYYLTTASYFVDEEGMNLTFLISAELSEFQKKHFDYGATRLYTPIRNLDTTTDGDAEEYRGWLYLLDLNIVNPPKNLKETYIKILKTEDNRYILNYVIEHWPEQMTQEDESLFRTIIKKHSKDAYIASPAIKRLARRGRRFEDKELIKLLKQGSPFQREELLHMVNRNNIDSCKDILFGWLLEEGDIAWLAEQETIETLARLCPDYLKEQLRRRDLPFWKLIPCLQALKINGSDIGKKDFSPQILALNPYTIRNVGEVFGGEEFYAILAMEKPQRHDSEDWKMALPLLEPLLEEPDSPKRRLVVGLMRTFGVKVKREGKKYVVIYTKEPVPPPVRIELVLSEQSFSLAKAIKLTLKETAVRDKAWFSFEGELGWHVDFEDGGFLESGGSFGVWDEVKMPKQAFLQLRKGYVHRTEQDISSLFTRPGTYKVNVRKVYSHDGGDLGLDAWTGAVFSEPIEIRVSE